ncbi:MAG TPA: tyrosine-protein phosphatase [Acidimicrobiales bacterium]|nr:tyrosine-protein phosphatase [Acidimicrobiales bacterium]
MRDTSLIVPQRRIPLDGARNFRDVGGYLTQSGEIVRWRHVFRSDSLDRLTATDTAVLREQLGITVVVDLRAAAADHRPRTWRRVRVPLPDLPTTREAGPRIVEILEIIADADGPVVFQCHNGRGRTGLVAAVLLGALGVVDDDIARDYALATGDAHPSETARMRPETMRAVLGAVRRDHGSMVGYVLDAGGDITLVESLRDALLR